MDSIKLHKTQKNTKHKQAYCTNKIYVFDLCHSIITMIEEQKEIEHTFERRPQEVQSGKSENEDYVRLISSFKAMTIRARESTRVFFEKVEAIVSERGLSTNDAATEMLIALLSEQSGARVQVHAYDVLLKEVEELRAKNDVLVNDATKSSEHHMNTPENGHLFLFPEKHLKLLQAIAQNRFKDVHVRARYKLKEQEDIGGLLLNCIMTEEILMDHNNCFFTGFTKDQMKLFKNGR